MGASMDAHGHHTRRETHRYRKLGRLFVNIILQYVVYDILNLLEERDQNTSTNLSKILRFQ